MSAFLQWLAVGQELSASTQNQALCALLFLHRDVLGHEIGAIQRVPRARTPVRLPVVLSRDEVGRLLKPLTGAGWIIVALLYGAGLRLQDCIARHTNGEWDLKIDLAEIWFCRIWRQYEQELCTTDERKAREDRVVERMMRQSGYDLRYAMHGRVHAKEWLSDNERLFNEFRRSFLMIDLFPENEVRFPVSYRDCVDAG